MYIYFDTNGTIKEIVNDKSIRNGSNEANKIYCYLEGEPEIDDIWYLQKLPSGELSNEVSFKNSTITKAIPYDAKRDMKYFKDFEQYKFYVFTLNTFLTSQKGLNVATIRVSVDNTIWALGELTFNVQENVINVDNGITQSQYDYLLLAYASRTLNEQTGSDLNELLDDKIEAKLGDLASGSPKVFDTEANIEDLHDDEGIAVATDTGDIWVWNDTQQEYVNTNYKYLTDASDIVYYTGNQLRDVNNNNIYPVLAEYLRNSNVMIPNNIEVSGSNIKYDFTVTKDVKPYKILMPNVSHQIIFLKNEVALFTIGQRTISEFVYNEYYDTLDYDTIRVYFVGSNDTTYKVYLLCDLAQYPIKLLDNDLKAIKSEISTDKKENEIADYDLKKSLANEEIRRNFVRNTNYYDLPTAVKQVAFLNRNIITDGYKYDLVGDIRDYKNQGGNTWYVGLDGIDDGTSGHSPTSAFRTLQYALNNVSSGDTIYIKKGIYPRNTISVCTINKSINIIAEEGCIFKVSDNYTYVKNATYTNVYQTVRSNVKEVIDITNFLKDNTLIKLTQVTSISEVNDTPNSWYNDGTNTYVRMYNDRIPNDENIVLSLNGVNGLSISPTSSDITVYLENINLIGGVTCFGVAGNDTYDTYVYALNCKFANTYEHNHNVVEVSGAYTCFENCVASYSGLDGFNYHAYNGTGKKCYSIEKNCIAFYNGIGNSVANCNGTTIHDGCMIIRINGTYYKNYGGNVADVQTGTISVNLNCLAFDSVGDTGGSYNTDFVAQQSGTTMYLENCRAFGSEYSIYAVTGTTIYVNNCTYSTTTGGGTLTITNSALNLEILLYGKANKSNTYTKTECNETFSHKYNGLSFFANIDPTHSASNGWIYTIDSDTHNQSYTQIMLAEKDLIVTVTNTSTYQIRKITMNNPYGLNPTLSSWGATQTISKGTYFIITIALIGTTGTPIAPKTMTDNIILSSDSYTIQDTIVTSTKYNSQTLRLEIDNDKEVTYSFGKLMDLGYAINVWELTSWEVSTSNNKNQETGWQYSLREATLPKGVYNLFFRKYSSGNLVDFSYQEVIENISIISKPKNKYFHFSLDDCVVWIDLYNNRFSYTSIFDNPQLAFYKELHDKYGFKITLNCFNTNGTVDIDTASNSTLATKFKTELYENRDWLKWAFHAEDENSNYSTDQTSAIQASYNKFVTAIYKMTGSYECIDRVTRLGFFTGTSSNVTTIRDCNSGIVGLLTADDTRVSYYLDSDTNNYILAHSHYFDATKQLMLIKTQTRLESATIDYDNLKTKFIENASYSNFNKYLEFFSHEYEISSIKTKMKAMCLWAVINGYDFTYWDDVFKL